MCRWSGGALTHNATRSQWEVHVGPSRALCNTCYSYSVPHKTPAGASYQAIYTSAANCGSREKQWLDLMIDLIYRRHRSLFIPLRKKGQKNKELNEDEYQQWKWAEVVFKKNKIKLKKKNWNKFQLHLIETIRHTSFYGHSKVYISAGFPAKT